MDFLITYGSHTGQSESIAAQLKEKCMLLGMNPRVHVLEENEKTFFIENEPLAVIIVSSTGDGDPPENAARFLRRISRRTLADDFLKNVTYALLGLGDSNYSTYQGVPRKFDEQLTKLGAKKLIPTGEADDEIGLELVVEPWIEQLLKKLCELDHIPISRLEGLTISTPLVKKEKEKKSVAEKPKLPTVMSTEDDRADSSTDRILKLAPYTYPGEISLIRGNEALSSDEALRVPIAPLTYLVTSVTHEKFEPKSVNWQNGESMPGLQGKPMDATVVGTTLLTDFDVHKPKRELVIDLNAHWDQLSYSPGDAFYFLQPNPEAEVNFILERMGLLMMADQKCHVTVAGDAKKPNAAVPGYIPPISSLRYIFTHCLDIRRAPGRPVLRVFADATSDEGEKRRLLELCSSQGMAEFTAHIRQAAVSIVDVLAAFPGVRPAPERLIEQLPRLIPRPYSVSNCYERARGRIRFVYSEMKFGVADGRRYERLGLATEWLNALRVGDQIQVMMKEPARFRFPVPPATVEAGLKMPLLMIGPGTGVSTFISFLDLLLHEKIKIGSLPAVPRKLFFGCRNFEKDFIYKDLLESYVREGILDELIACESQPAKPVPGRHCYVQEALRQRADEVWDFIQLEESRIFICGDAKAMSKDTWECFAKIVAEKKGCSDAEAKAFLLELKKANRYIEDVWA
ncbi:unnamed protein product, partial [Mesorhabditis spiculigera]